MDATLLFLVVAGEGVLKNLGYQWRERSRRREEAAPMAGYGSRAPSALWGDYSPLLPRLSGSPLMPTSAGA